MVKFDLSIFDESRSAIIRNAIADYLKVGDDYELMGAGFVSLDESPNAQSESETYINEATASSDITSYESEFSYESRLIPSQAAVYALYKTGRDHAVGVAAQFEYIRVDLFNPIGTPSTSSAEYKARKFVVSNEVSSISGAGGEKVSVSGTLKCVGDPVQGKYDTVSGTFTAGTYTGKYDTAAPDPDPEDPDRP